MQIQKKRNELFGVDSIQSILDFEVSSFSPSFSYETSLIRRSNTHRTFVRRGRGGITQRERIRSTVNAFSLLIYGSRLMIGTALYNNSDAYNRVWFRPKVMIDVTDVDTSTKILGVNSSIPVYVSPTARNGLGQPLVPPFPS